ncbi:MAG: SpoIVB peptidase [Christensenellaceae bacterium]|jgi:stage IV sporulation protein B|nr:SpoIVB peptidase [Christensenellaceae bacterium]
MKARLFKKLGIALGAVALVFCLLYFAVLPASRVFAMPDNMIIYSSDIGYINQNRVFGQFVNVELKKSSVPVVKAPDVGEVEFKLFNLIPIKTHKVVIGEDEVLAGGMPVGLVISAEGALIVGSSVIETDGNTFDITKSGLKVGDIITHIEDEKVENTGSISKFINKKENGGRELKITAMRKNKEYEFRVKPAYDIKSDSFKLGVWVRDDASGIGTLTFIDDKNRFGALGHPICDGDTGVMMAVKSGNLYGCNILGLNKGVAGDPGEIRGLFLQGKNSQGHIDKNSEFGVFGEISQNSLLLDQTLKLKVGGRLTVSPGKAQIRSAVDGNLKLYDIEIIKTNYQNYQNDRSMVIRIIDPELLEKTGGIIQGMSGSPIIQNGKLVGAVTHVFVNDPTKGFGVYMDWMLGQ